MWIVSHRLEYAIQSFIIWIIFVRIDWILQLGVCASERKREKEIESVCMWKTFIFDDANGILCMMYLANILDSINQITKQHTPCWNFFSIACEYRGMACDRDWNMDFCQVPHSLIALQGNFSSSSLFEIGNQKQTSARAENGEKHPVVLDVKCKLMVQMVNYRLISTSGICSL